MSKARVINDVCHMVDYKATADVAYGDVVPFQASIGVAAIDIKAGETGPVQVSGAFELDKDTAVAISAGDVVYYVAASGKINKTASGNLRAGIAIRDAASADTKVRVKLC